MKDQENSLITINVDKKTKDEANKVFKDLGLNMSSAINIYLKACIKANGIPFMLQNNDSNSNK